MSRLSDELIKQIAEGSGRVYNHEGKKMAQEIREWREAAAKAAAAAKIAAAPAPGGFTGTPWGLFP
jgi:hypothetical protein